MKVDSLLKFILVVTAFRSLLRETLRLLSKALALTVLSVNLHVAL